MQPYLQEDDKLLQQVESFAEEEEEEDEVMEEIECYQDGDGNLPAESESNLHRSSTDAGLQPATPNLYVAIGCRVFP